MNYILRYLSGILQAYAAVAATAAVVLQGLSLQKLALNNARVYYEFYISYFRYKFDAALH